MYYVYKLTPVDILVTICRNFLRYLWIFLWLSVDIFVVINHIIITVDFIVDFC